jgi:glyoxylase-like metal-dependent hydrolase (beta-lactamase superfamily II)
MPAAYERGLVQVGPTTYAFLQPDGSWGWSNAGLVVGDDAAILVDTFFDLPNTAELLSSVRSATDRPIRTLVNTHHNGDHCFGNQLVEGATIVGHRRCRDELLRGATPALLAAAADAPDEPGAAGYLKRAFSPFDFTGIDVVPPTVTFDDRLSLHAGDHEVLLEYFGPCHTLGDIAVWVPGDRVLFAGDLAFIGSTPLVWEGSLINWIATVDRLLALEPEVIVPGHGPVTNAEGLRSMDTYLRHVVTEGSKLKDAGLSPQDAAREIDLGAYAVWKDPERLVLNLMRLWLELDGQPAETRVDAFEAFAAMDALARAV